MANAELRRHLTDRDLEILAAIDRTPLTVEQLLKASETFPSQSFSSVRSVQDRLHKLRQAGWVRRWTYATASRGGAPDYYRLTLEGFRILYGKQTQPPRKRQFAEVGLAHQRHTRSLSDFIVHTLVAAHRSGARLRNFYPENELRLEVAGGILYPDCAFELLTADGRQFNFVVEGDHGTERVRSQKDIDSIERKIRLYDELQDQSYPHRFRVLFYTTGTSDRLRHILDASAQLVRNPYRALFYGVLLEDYLRELAAIHAHCFTDHRGRRHSLLPDLAGRTGAAAALSKALSLR